jgi:hypothetical protein
MNAKTVRAGRFATIRELLGFMARKKAWWVTPLVIMLLLFGTLAVLAEMSAISPFIYALF